MLQRIDRSSATDYRNQKFARPVDFEVSHSTLVRIQSTKKKDTMQYVLLIYTNTARWEELTTDEKNRIHEECGVWHEELVKNGNAVTAVGLQPASTASTFSAKEGKVIVTDGPFAETREVLGGLEIVECRNLDEAMEIARRFPALRVGSLMEVRPLVAGGVCRD